MASAVVAALLAATIASGFAIIAVSSWCCGLIAEGFLAHITEKAQAAGLQKLDRRKCYSPFGWQRGEEGELVSISAQDFVGHHVFDTNPPGNVPPSIEITHRNGTTYVLLWEHVGTPRFVAFNATRQARSKSSAPNCPQKMVMALVLCAKRWGIYG